MSSLSLSFAALALGGLWHVAARHLRSPSGPGATRTVRLLRDGVRRLPRDAVAITCLRGTAWVTVEGDAEDRFLEAGQRRVLPRDRRVVMQAIGARGAVVRVDGHPAADSIKRRRDTPASSAPARNE